MTNPTERNLESKGKVVSLSAPADEMGTLLEPRAKRRRILWVSLLLCVLLPIVLVAAYYAVFASDRYATRIGFSIRGIDTASGIDGIGALTGLASVGTTTSDSYIVLEYLQGRELLESVDERLNLRAVYSDPDVDWISRLSDDALIEDFVDYWNKRIHTEFDPTSGIIEFEAQSFSPEHAQEIARTVLTLAQELVNQLSISARQDALRFALHEVELQEARLRSALNAIREFRSSEQSVNPSASAALEIELLASLTSRLIDINARISAQRETLDANAPTVVALRRNAEALEAQIAERRQAIGADLQTQDGSSAVTVQLARYETLEVERTLAEQAYASALSSLEQARRDADRQQRYLAVHLQPQMAESAEYPKGVRNTLLIAFGVVAAWGIGTLITYSVRDHLT